MYIYTVSFFGHRMIRNPVEVERRLEDLVCDLLHREEYVHFLVGRNGEFDLLAASVIRRCRRAIRDDNSSLILVLPYPTAEYRREEQAYLTYYDEVEICEASANAHYRAAFAARNRWMIDQSDLVVCCVQHAQGGAYAAMAYARDAGKAIADMMQEQAQQ